MVDLLLPLQEPYRLIESLFIICGIWVDGRLAHMVYYQIKYGGESGNDYYYGMNKEMLHAKYRSNEK